jgi:hypothetical protein
VHTRIRVFSLSNRNLIGAVIALSAIAALGHWALYSKPKQELISSVAIDVESQVIPSFLPSDPSRVRFGALEYRGGLALRTKDPHFGGISGLRLSEEGSALIAVTDSGNIVQGRLVYQQGQLSGASELSMAPLLGPGNIPLRQLGKSDIEAIELREGRAYVSFEDSTGGIASFDLPASGQKALAALLPAPKAIEALPKGRGLESLAAFPIGHPLYGALLAIAERDPTRGRESPAWILSADGGVSPLAVSISDRYEISDAVFLPEGDLLLLERKLSLLSGFKMRIRRVNGASVRPDAVLEGVTLIESGPSTVIDNMEGIAVHRSAFGETILSLVSDDNFRFFQKTVLLQFVIR